MNTLTQNSTKLKALGIYQIFGGVTGIGLAVYLFLKLPTMNFFALLLTAFILLFFIYSIVCGIFLFRNVQKGIHLSLINQVLQIFSLSVGGFAFKYCAGIYLITGIDLTNTFLLNFGFGLSTFQININSEKNEFIAGVNLAAIVLVIFLSNLKKKLKREKDNSMIASIGVSE